MLGETLKKGRLKKNVTQSELGREVGVSRTYIAGIEGGAFNPSARVLIRLAEALDLDLNFFKNK